jgi:hypothetical protein
MWASSGGRSTPVVHISNSAVRTSSQRWGSCRPTSASRNGGGGPRTIQSTRTMPGIRAGPSRRRSSSATHPAWESATGTTRSTPAAAITASASSASSALPKSPPAGDDPPWPCQSSARARRHRPESGSRPRNVVRFEHQPGMNSSAGSPSPMSSNAICGGAVVLTVTPPLRRRGPFGPLPPARGARSRSRPPGSRARRRRVTSRTGSRTARTAQPGLAG